MRRTGDLYVDYLVKWTKQNGGCFISSKIDFSELQRSNSVENVVETSTSLEHHVDDDFEHILIC